MIIETTMKYHLISIRMAIIPKSTNSECWRGCWGKETLLHCWWGCQLIQPLWRTVWRCLSKLGVKLPYDPAIPLLGIYPGETINQKNTCTPMLIASLFTIAQTWMQSRRPLTYEWIKTPCIIEYCLAINRNEFESVEVWSMNLETAIQSEVRKRKINIT